LSSFALRLARNPAWVFGEPDFWRLWYAGLTVFLVRWMETLGMALFVYQRTGSPFLVAMTQMLRLLPMGLLGAFLGAGAERIERRTALALVTAMMAGASGSLAVLAWTGHLAVWHIMLACFVNGIGWAADNPVRRVAIGEVVGAERMGAAMSLDVAANNGSRMLGPTLGGVLLAVLGIAGLFTLSVVLYVTSLAATFMLRYRNQYMAAGQGSVLARIGEGLRVVRHDPRLVGTLVVTVIYNVFAWPFTSMVPVIAQGNLHLNDAHTGLLQSMDGVGAFFGAMLIAVLARRREDVPDALRGRRARLPGDDHRLRAAARASAGGRRPGGGGIRGLGLQHHAGDARLPVRAARDAQPDAGRAVGLHRLRPAWLSPYRPAGGMAGRANGNGRDRDRGIAGDGVGLAVMAADWVRAH
jgi:hypothetical protein